MKNKLFAALAALVAVGTFCVAGHCDQEILNLEQGIRKEDARIVRYVIETADGNLWECDCDEDCTVTFQRNAIIDIGK